MFDLEPVVGLDIGSSAIRGILSEYDEKGAVRVAATHELPAKGIRQGIVTNVEEAVESVGTVLDELEVTAGRTIKSLNATFSGVHIEGLNSRGVQPITSGEGRQITKSDREKVLEVAATFSLPPDREIINIYPKDYIIDFKPGFDDPVSQSGGRLEVETHIVIASATVAGNIERVIGRTNRKIGEIIPGGIAAAKAVLSPEESREGVLLINIGHSTTDIVLLFDKAPHSIASLPIGSSLVSSDLSKLLNVSEKDAELLKIGEGSCWYSYQEDHSLEFRRTDKEVCQLSKKVIGQIVAARMEELFDMIHQEAARRGMLDLALRGVRITGGGAEMLGVEELARSFFQKEVKVVKASPLNGLDSEIRHPAWSAALGAMLTGIPANIFPDTAPLEKEEVSDVASFRSIFQKTASWLREFV